MFIRRHQTRPDQIRSDLDATKWKIYGKISNTLAGTRPDNPKPLLALCCRHGLWSLSRKPIPGWKSNAEHVPRLCFPRAWYMKTSTTYSGTRTKRLIVEGEVYVPLTHSTAFFLSCEFFQQTSTIINIRIYRLWSKGYSWWSWGFLQFRISVDDSRAAGFNLDVTPGHCISSKRQ